MKALNWETVIIDGHEFDCDELMAEALDFRPSIEELKHAKNNRIVKSIKAVASDLNGEKISVVFNCEFGFTEDYENPVMPLKVLV